MRKPLSILIVLNLTINLAVGQNGNVGIRETTKIFDGNRGFKAETNSKYLGKACKIGDLDGDGISEYVFVGTVIDVEFLYVVFFDKDMKVRKQTVIGQNEGGLSGDIATPFTSFASDICALGDIDDDGIPDIAVSDFLKQSVYILMLNKNGTVKSFKRLRNGSHGLSLNLSEKTQFGITLCSHDDLDGDGNKELLVGDPGDRGKDGVMYLLFLNNNGEVKKSLEIGKSTTWNTYEPTDDNLFAGACSLIGDINGDGISELLVGAPYDVIDGAFAGSFYIIFHNKNFEVDSAIKHYPGSIGLLSNLSESSIFSGEIRALGDLDGNGVTDVAFSAQWDSTNNKRTGSCYILFFDSLANVDTFIKISEGSENFSESISNNAYFGLGLTATGDMNGDGTLDFMVSGPRDAEGGTDAGAIYLIYLAGKKYVNTTSPNALEASIYPNPANNAFQIKTKEQTEVKVLNACGQVVWQGKAKGQQTIDTSQWKVGMYFVLISEANHDLSTQKLIIQH